MTVTSSPLRSLFRYCLLAVLLSACSTAMKIDQYPSPLLTPDSADLHQRGLDIYNKWKDHDDVGEQLLHQAYDLLKQARDISPMNDVYKIDYYNALAALSGYQTEFDEASLLREFNTLHPEAKAEAITPAFVSFKLAQWQSKRSDQALTEDLYRAISQNPYNPQNWYYLSNLLRELGEYRLASAASGRAEQIVPGYGNYAYFSALNLVDLATVSRCSCDNQKLLRYSIQKLGTALQLEPDNALYLALNSRQYLATGLLPLALRQAKRAFENKPSLLSAKVLFRVAYLSKHFADAEKAADYLQKNNADVSAVDLALWYYYKKDPNALADQIVKTRSYLGSMASMPLLHMTPDQAASILPSFVSAASKLPDRVKDLFNKKISTKEFVASASSPCERSDYEFYAAIFEYVSGNSAAYQSHLREVIKSGATLEESYYWSWALLNT